MLKAIIFDFDGVVLESIETKTRAFKELFKDYPEHLDSIVKLHLDNCGMSRFEKFKIIYRDYLGLPIDERELERLGQAFSQLVYEEVLGCPFVPGAYQFLKKYSTRYDLFVASGTPEDELRGIVKQRELDRFFRDAYGSPQDKGEILKRILREWRFKRGEVVLVGDAISDYMAAREGSVTFIGRVSKGKSNPFPDDGVVALVEDLHELDQQWNSVVRKLRWR